MAESKTYCKERVYHARGTWGGSPCARVATRDGYCAQHHPEAVRARDADRKARWKAKSECDVARWERERLTAEFANACAEWLAEGAAPLSPDALYPHTTDETTFGDIARKLASSPSVPR